MTPALALPRNLERGALAAGALVAGGLVAMQGDDLARAIVVAASVGALAAWIVWQDLRDFTISDAAILSIAFIAIACRTIDAQMAGISLSEALTALALDALLPGAVLLAAREVYFRRKGYDGLGLGDVKLAVAGSMLVGMVGFSWALFLASFAALAFVAVRRLVARPMASGDKLAFGAVLAPALWLVWLAERLPALLANA